MGQNSEKKLRCRVVWIPEYWYQWGVFMGLIALTLKYRTLVPQPDGGAVLLVEVETRDEIEIDRELLDLEVGKIDEAMKEFDKKIKR